MTAAEMAAVSITSCRCGGGRGGCIRRVVGILVKPISSAICSRIASSSSTNALTASSASISATSASMIGSGGVISNCKWPSERLLLGGFCAGFGCGGSGGVVVGVAALALAVAVVDGVVSVVISRFGGLIGERGGS